MSANIEILGPAVKTQDEADMLIRAAVEHFRIAKRATIQVMADLRRLQDAQVHVVYGYKNFAKWAEHTFEGLSMGAIHQLCRAGAVVIELERRGEINLNAPEGVGTTGLRELSVVANTYGTDKMVEVFQKAKEISEAREVTGTTVTAALQLLMPPAQIDPPKPQPVEDQDDDDDDEDEGNPPKVQELIERVRDLSYDLPECLEELQEAVAQLDRELKGVSSDQDELWEESSR
jgi:hypothetical protein